MLWDQHLGERKAGGLSRGEGDLQYSQEVALANYSGVKRGSEAGMTLQRWSEES